MLERYLLRYFLAVVDQGNFSRAANACNISQPTLSTGIAKLERALACSLFVRSNQRVELTEGGARFLQFARRIEREFNMALQAMGKETELPLLRIGILTSIPSAIISAAVQSALPCDDYRLELLFKSERELASHLTKGRIDLALSLVRRGSSRFAECTICEEDYMLVLAKDHPLAAKKEISPEQLSGEPMIVRRHCEALSETSRFFTERGIRPHFTLRSTNDEQVLNMVAAGLGVTMMPRCYRHPGVQQVELSGFSHSRTIGWMVSYDCEHILAAPSALMLAIEEQLALSSNDLKSVTIPY